MMQAFCIQPLEEMRWDRLAYSVMVVVVVRTAAGVIISAGIDGVWYQLELDAAWHCHLQVYTA
jgi:hypothetical protein